MAKMTLESFVKGNDMANSPKTYAEKIALLKQLQEEIQADRVSQLDSIVQ